MHNTEFNIGQMKYHALIYVFLLLYLFFYCLLMKQNENTKPAKLLLVAFCGLLLLNNPVLKLVHSANGGSQWPPITLLYLASVWLLLLSLTALIVYRKI